MVLPMCGTQMVGSFLNVQMKTKINENYEKINENENKNYD